MVTWKNFVANVGAASGQERFKRTTANLTEHCRALELLSIVIPARDEESCIQRTVENLNSELSRHGIHHEIIVVDDGSCDKTWKVLSKLQLKAWSL